MPINAEHKFSIHEAEIFLKSGALLGFGTDMVLVGFGEAKSYSGPQGDEIEFYAPDFFLEDPKPWWKFQHSVYLSRNELKSVLGELCKNVKPTFEWKKPAKQKFKEIFSSIQTEISANKIEKAVPVVFAHEEHVLSISEKAKFIFELLQNSQKPTPYGIWNEKSGMLGGSPEVLVSFDAKTQMLSTMALAGTRKSELEEVQSLVTDPKEMFEHELVIKDIREKLNGLGEFQISPTYVWNLGSICHLRTDIQIELDKTMTSKTVIAEVGLSMHPTAALGVFPRSADWRQIRQWQTAANRGRFGAPFGVLSRAGRSQLVVAIRNLQWTENQILLGTGCGIVKDSIFENEWNELNVKRQSILKLFGMQS